MCPPTLFAVVIDLPASPGVVVLGALVLALPVVVSTINGLLSIIKSFRKTPPDHDHYATKAELREVRDAAKTEMLEVEERIASAAEERNRTLLATIARSEARMVEVDTRISHQLDRGETLFNSVQRELSANAAAIAELRGRVHNLSPRK